MTIAIHLDTAALDAMLDDLGTDIEAAVRPAAQAAAQVLYDEVKRNVAALGAKTGNLGRAVYQAYATHTSIPGSQTYNVSWNPAKAPHGGLVEFGHIQRYVSYIDKRGNWKTLVRPEMRGKPRPGRRASQAAKDAYYVTLATPKQVAARSFVRSAAVKFPQALDAAAAELMRRVGA